MTRQDVLARAKNGKVFVHRYKWSHERLRKLTRRLHKDKLLTLIAQNKDGFLYVAAQGEQG